MSSDQHKRIAAEKAIEYIKPDITLGVGTGSTVHHFIEALSSIKHTIKQAVSSSEDSTQKLKALGIPVVELNQVHGIDLYVDGADEITPHKMMIKGGGGALTREKILATCSDQFICIVDQSKCVKVLGDFPLPVEVLPMARSYISRLMFKFGGQPIYREQCITDNGNEIIDVHQLEIIKPAQLESELNQIPGVICNGIFAHRPADIVIIGSPDGVTVQ